MELERKYIYDPLLRIIHATMGMSCLILLTSAYSAEFFYEEGIIRKSFWIVHIYSGYILTIALLLRFIWGIIGGEHAKLKKLFFIQEWRDFFVKRQFQFTWNWGHHPLASLAYIAFYVVASLLSVTGIFLSAIEHNLGPLANTWYDRLQYKHDFAEVHESLSFFIILFIFTHLFALYWHEKIDQIPIVQSMFSGFQYRKKKESSDEDEK